MINHIRIEKRPNSFKSSSGEYWTISESLIQQYYKTDEDILIVKV
jgi:hypothetical protein